MYSFNLLIGPFIINNYNLFNFIGLFLLFILMITLAEKGKRWQALAGCAVGILAGTTGAKLTHLLLYAEEYRGMSPGQVFLTSGHAYIGGAIFALLALYILFRYYKVSFLYVGDYVTPFFGLARAFGRIGCLLTGCCHGSVSHLPWTCYFGDGLLRHPTQGYMIILTFSIFLAGVLNLRKLKDKHGIIFFSTILMYGLGRFFVEFFRVDSPYILGPLKLSHIILIPISLYGLVGLYILYRRYSLQAPVAAYIRRLFGSFALSLAIISIFVLTILSILPKLNYTDEIDLRIGKNGIKRVEPKMTVDYGRIKKIKGALERYKRDNGACPTQEQGLKALVEKPAVKPIPRNWHGPYIDKRMLLSKNGRPYEYMLDRYGDGFSYRIRVPSAKKLTPLPGKKRNYLLEVEVHHALARYKFDNNRYPTQRQGLKALIKKPRTEPMPQNWNGPYLGEPLKNKKGKGYRYKIEKRGDEDSYSIYTD